MLLVGLTGNIASGKSTVGALLEQYGATLIDADLLARKVLDRDTPGFESVVSRWGQKVLSADGSIDRSELRRLVFANSNELNALNEIVHPRVKALRDALVDEARKRGDRIVVCDIPLLFETESGDDFHVLVVVDAPADTRLRRLVEGRGLDESEAKAMIAAQMPSDAKLARADHVIDNSGTHHQLKRRVKQVWAALDRAAHDESTS